MALVLDPHLSKAPSLPLSRKTASIFVALVFFCILALGLIDYAAQRKTDAFSVQAISARHKSDPSFATSALPPAEEAELKQALSQSYSYLACGAQTHVFVSQDGAYVIKFFKQRLYHPCLIDHLRKGRVLKKAEKLRRDFMSYKAAFETLPEETGVLYLHLLPTDHLKTNLQIYDKNHRDYTLFLDDFEFIIQRRAERAQDRLYALLSAGKKEEAKTACRSLFALIAARAKKGFCDRDPDIGNNCGFLGDKAIKLDVGRLVKDPKMVNSIREEIAQIALPFRAWIAWAFPSFLAEFDEELAKACEI